MKYSRLHRTLVAALLSPCMAASQAPQSVQAEPASGAQVTTTATSPTQPADSESLVLSDGIQLRITVQDGFSSETAKVGDVIRFTLADSVWADGLVAIPRGTPLTSKVVSVTAPRHGGRDGQVSIAFDGFILPTGGSATVRATFGPAPRTHGKGEQGAHDGAELVAGSVMFTPVFLVFAFKKGSPQVVSAGTDGRVFLNGPLHINRKSAMNLPPPADAGFAYFNFVSKLSEWKTRRLYCGQEDLGYFYPKTTIRLSLRPGTYWFSTGRKKDRAVKIVALAGHQYSIEGLPGGLSAAETTNNEQNTTPAGYVLYKDLTDVGAPMLDMLTRQP